MRNSRTPAGFMPNRLPLGRQSRCRLAPSNPLKTKRDGWVGWQALVRLTYRLWAAPWGTSHSKGTSQPPASPVSTHAKQQNPSRIHAQQVKNKAGWMGGVAGIGWVDVTALGSTMGHQPLQRHVTAASVAGEHACETAEPQQDSGPTGWSVSQVRVSLAIKRPSLRINISSMPKILKQVTLGVEKTQ